jgi:ubiquinone/menaquinone biosynthesis C-methylase UbiE
LNTDPVDADAFNAFEAAGWEEHAAAYVRHLTVFTRPLIDPLLDAAGVDVGTRVLDVASGPGHVAAAAAARGAVPIGVDIAASMVALAGASYPNLVFRRGDAQRLPVEDTSVDAVVGNFAIPHLGRPELAAAEFARVLVPGGRVALTTWNVPASARHVGLVVDAVAAVGAAPPPPSRLPPGPSFFRFADEPEFAGLLSGAGFRDVVVQTVDFRQRVSSATEHWEAILAGSIRIGTLVTAQPERVQAKIRAEYDGLAAEYQLADGSLELPVSVKLASGVRPR